MNNTRRSQITDIMEQLSPLQTSIEELLEEEQEAFDNLPESIQDSERGEAIQAAIDNLEEAVGNCEELLNNLEMAKE